jgi:hypothetical protein
MTSAEHFGELDVHLHQRLLHALHPTGLLGEQHFALACHRARNWHKPEHPGEMGSAQESPGS